MIGPEAGGAWSGSCWVMTRGSSREEGQGGNLSKAVVVRGLRCWHCGWDD